MKYAILVNGAATNPVTIPQPWPDHFWTNDPVEFCERMFPGTTGWELVADDVGEPARQAPKPNNPGNLYFGKTPKSGGEFWGLLQAVYVGLSVAAGGTKESGLDRLYRLRSSRRAAGVLESIRASSLIDPDDAGGDFLKGVKLLTTTDHEDGAGKIMEPQELVALMAAWL